jgi:hypothetical protein
MEGVGGELRARGRRGLTAALVVALGAAAFAPSAWADGSEPTPPTPVAGDVGAGDTIDVAAIVSEVAAAIPEIPSEPVAALVESDTVGDTAPDITATAQESGSSGNTAAPAVKAPEPVTVQADPANLNVSIRIDSPGDDGAVTQSNTAATATQQAASPPARASTGAAAPPAAKPSGTTAPASTGASPEASPSASPDTPGTWQWTWDCVSPPDVHAPVLRDADGELLTWNWTWIWNCAGNTEAASSGGAQYQSATGNDTTGQYQPGNVNIAIRISSPGSNGPVNQSNVAVTVAVPTSSSPSAGVAGGTAVRVDVQVPGVADALPSSASSASFDAPLDVVAEALDDIEQMIASFGGSPLSDDVKSLLAVPCCVSASSLSIEWLPGGPCGDVGRGVLRLPGLVRRELWAERCLESQVGVAPCRCLPPRPPQGTSGAVSPIWAASGVTGSSSVLVEATRASKLNRAKPTLDRPSQRVPTPTGVSGAALGAAPAGSSSGGPLPVSLLIPFFVGLLDLLRRVAVTKVTLPTGLSGGTFDPPG